MTQPSIGYRYNSPPNWPTPPSGWKPGKDWKPDPKWGPAPEGWTFWVEEGGSALPPPPGGWAEPAAPRLDNSVAWLIVVAPLLYLCVSAVLYLAHVNAEGLDAVAFGVVTLGLCVWDERLVKRAGLPVSSGFAFLVPIYLFQRARRAGQTLLMPVAFIATLVVAVTGGVVLASSLGPVVMDMHSVETQIGEQLSQQYGTDASVSCPVDDIYYPHETFDCTATDASASVIVRVTVEDHSGRFTWQPVGPAS
jgi:hypothetical protein